MPLDRALRRARTPLSEVECFTYDGKSCVGTLTSHHMPEALYVADRENEHLEPPKLLPGFSNSNRNTSNLEKEQGNTNTNTNTVIEMVTELEKMSILHRACPTVAPLDPITRYVRIGVRRYPLYLCGGDVLATPTTMAEVMDIAKTLSHTIKRVHDAGYVLWNISHRSIYYGHLTGGKSKQVKLGPNIVIPMRKQSFADFKGSVILGSTIVSPIQVLIDMLSSRYEQDLVPFSEFKAKFSGFWPRTIHKDFRHVPDIVSCYHSMKDGSTEYLDHLFCRWLTIKTEKNARFVVKDPGALLKPAVLRCVDWFALGVTLDGYVEALLEKEAPPKALTEAIYTMVVCMECGVAAPRDAP
jgi:hypothetical protein